MKITYRSLSMVMSDWYDSRRQWHPWFAWRPVRIDREVVWHESLERKRVDWYMPGDGGGSYWEYRIIPIAKSSLIN